MTYPLCVLSSHLQILALTSIIGSIHVLPNRSSRAISMHVPCAGRSNSRSHLIDTKNIP